MQRYLINHALSNAWCNPQQDNLIILAARRLTKDNGELNRFTLMNRQVGLPSSGKRYHVYQIGQILPLALGLKPTTGDWEPERWIKFSSAMNSQKVIVNLYTATGVNIPRYSSYYMFSEEKDLIFALEIDSSIPVNLNTDTVYLRLYSNAYFQSTTADAITNYIQCNGKKVTTIQHILDVQATVAGLMTLSGHVSCYVNGLLTGNISPVNVSIGDSIEYVYDSSVKRVVTFTVSSLLTFQSTLDSKFKYLLHHLGNGNDTIDYQDDIDINIISVASNGTKKGVYYHHNNPNAYRMVTHRDYSIVVDYFDYLADAMIAIISDTPLDSREFKLEVVIRNSGYYRPLIQDNSRIFELYKLPDEKIVQAMVGVNSTLDVWRAENLEACAYTRMMRSNAQAINMTMVQDAYGYNGISKIVGDTPTKTVLRSGVQAIDLPYALADVSTGYEYDSNGVLLGVQNHSFGTDYNSANSNCILVEVISGKGSVRPEVVFGEDNLPVPQYDNYRVYQCFLNNGVPNNIWRDVTGTNQYRVENNVLIWNNLEYGQFLMIRSDSSYLSYDIDITSVNGNMFFTLTEEENRGNGYQTFTLPVPLGQLDIFLNGRSLINGLDYIVKFPMVHILNKSYLEQPAAYTPQRIHVRFTGFCDRDLHMESVDDYGFIQHGYLSSNSRFDIRDDKVLRITVDGRTMHRSDLEFSEDHDGVSIVNPSNGKPYQIRDIIVPLKELVDSNTYSLRDLSLEIDGKVSDYMTVNLPEAIRGNLMAIPSRYSLVSPFMSRMLNALVDNEINLSVVESNLSDMDIVALCQPFEFLLGFDPINPNNEFDFRFVQAIPHRNNAVLTLTIVQYRLMEKIVKLYGNGQINLSSFVNFSS